MKRLITGTLVLLLLIAACLTAIPFLVSSQTVRNGITAKIEEVTGNKVTFQGDPSLSFSPFLGFEISDLELASPENSDDQTPLLKVEKVKAQINLLPALSGNVEITEYQFLRPRFFLKTDENGKSNWKFSKGKFRNAIEAAFENRTNQTTKGLPDLTVGNLLITDGILLYQDTLSNTEETITGMNGMLSWPQADKELDLSGNGIWRGEGITTNLNIANPIEIFSGGESNVTLDLNSQPISFTFDGMANMFSNLFVKGELEANSPSISRLAEVLKIDLGDFTSSDPWSAQGILEATSNNTNLSEASFSIGQDSATGVIRLSSNESEKSKLDGTLAFEQIDLVNYFNALGAKPDKIINPTLVKDLNIDLRVSSESINIGTITLDRVAAAIIVDEQGWTFDIGDANAFDGKLIAKLGERIDEDKRQAFLELSATDMDAQSISNLFASKVFGISGRTSFAANVRTNKLSEGLLNSGINGTFSGEFKEGQIKGIDLTDLITKTANELAKEPFALRENASTSYQQMNAKLFLNNGIATLSQTNLETQTAKIQAIGDINLYQQTLDIQLQEIAEDKPKPYRYLFKGSVFKPVVTFQDDQNLINQN
jgi:AsmA protein